MKSMIAAGLLAVLAVAPAKADVIFNIIQTSPSYTNSGPSAPPTVPLTTFAQVIVTDQAAAAGFTISADNRNPFSAPAQLDGLVGITVEAFGDTAAPFKYTLPDFINYSLSNNMNSLSFSLQAVAGGLLSGTIDARNTDLVLKEVLNGTATVSGSVTNDFYGSRCGLGGCTYTATQSRTAVPEPASLALFGAGLAGIAVARRRKS